MKIGIGIDTGGTYTDAVIYDFNQNKILFSAKALTTKEDLAKGIGEALDQLPKNLLTAAELVSLSTTLATNACVEGKGGRGKLIFIGADKDVVDNTGKSYGLPDSKEIYFLDGELNYKGEVVREPDWDYFIRDSRQWMMDADAIGVVQQLGIRNSECEVKAKDLILKEFGLNTVCGHELFSDLNYIKRGSSTLLNAKLITVIDHFLKAILKSLQERAIKAPVVIVRSDGSLMSESFATNRPVETLLCGPAASVMGGIKLTGVKDCLIVDMGGTTTDMVLVKEGVPVIAEEGVKVGNWKTFVKSVYIDTFGLGGDSFVQIDKNGQISLGSNRVIPLCIAAKQWPQVIGKLEQLIRSKIISDEPYHEFFCLVKDITNVPTFNDTEIKLCKALKDGPLIYSEVVNLLGKRSCFTLLKRLESEGVIMRCGITPTDIMHMKGDFCQFSKEAASLGTDYLHHQYTYVNRLHGEKEIALEDFCNKIYDIVKETLYFNIVRMLLEEQFEKYKRDGIDETMKEIIRESWRSFRDGGKKYISLGFAMPSASLVGVGAPIHIFLPDVAKALETKCVIPKDAGVANALGAIVGNVRVTKDIYVKPDEEKGFIIFCKLHNLYTEDYEEAIEIAKEEAKKEAIDEAIRRGANGDISISVTVDDHSNLKGITTAFLSTTVHAVAVGRVSFDHSHIKDVIEVM